MDAPGLYEISGLAWSGYGKIAKVEVSADGGTSWAPAALQEPVLSMAVTRFRSPGAGTAARRRCRAARPTIPDTVQPTRAKLIADRGARADLPLQRHRQLGRGARRRGQTCLCVTRCFAACSALLVGCGAALAESPNLGKAASPEEIAAWDISIGPDGAGLPSGSGTPQQGEQVYLAKCVGCHGEKGAGKPNDQLVGGQGSLGPGQAPVKTVGSFWPYATTLFDYVRRAMPLNESKSLTR